MWVLPVSPGTGAGGNRGTSNGRVTTMTNSPAIEAEGVPRRGILKHGAIITGSLLVGGSAVTGTVAADPVVKNIRCGQTKVGDVSIDDPLDSVGNHGDIYRLVLGADATVTATLVGFGPGNDKGQGNKGGNGGGKGQTESEPWVGIVPEGGDPFTDLITGNHGLGDQEAEVVVALTAGTYDIHAQDSVFDGGNEPHKYQLTVSCEP